MLRSGPPTEPSSADFKQRLAAAGQTFAQAGVSRIYILHGTFAGNDALGLYTELERVAPGAAHALRRMTKRAFNAVVGETGNYTPAFVQRLEHALGAGANRPIPVRLFNWSSMNHHIARADAAVRLIDELAQLENLPVPSPLRGGLGRGAEATGDSQLHSPSTAPSRIQLWAHSHGGNVFALLTNLLAADEQTRHEFFEAARVFHGGTRTDPGSFPAWQRVEHLLADADHPVRRLPLDLVTFGTPVRYGWDSLGASKLLHISHHVPHRQDAHHAASYPPHLWRLLTGAEGDFVQQLGIAGTNFPPLPIAWRTWLANRRLGHLLERDLPRQWIRSRLKHGTRMHHEGMNLLVDYEDPDRSPHRHIFGHAPYTRSRWLAFHADLIAEHFYGQSN